MAAKTPANPSTPVRMCLVYEKKTVEIDVPQSAFEEAITLRDRTSCVHTIFNGKDIHGRSYSVEVGSLARALYAQDIPAPTA